MDDDAGDGKGEDGSRKERNDDEHRLWKRQARLLLSLHRPCPAPFFWRVAVHVPVGSVCSSIPPVLGVALLSSDVRHVLTNISKLAPLPTYRHRIASSHAEHGKHCLRTTTSYRKENIGHSHIFLRRRERTCDKPRKRPCIPTSSLLLLGLLHRELKHDILPGQTAVDRGERVKLVLERSRVLGVKESIAQQTINKSACVHHSSKFRSGQVNFRPE